MKLKNYQEGRLIVLNKLPLVYGYPGKNAEVCSDNVVRIRRASELFAAVFMRREILLYSGKSPVAAGEDSLALLNSTYGRDKIAFYHQDGEGKFHLYRSVDTNIIFGKSGRRLTTLWV